MAGDKPRIPGNQIRLKNNPGSVINANEVQEFADGVNNSLLNYLLKSDNLSDIPDKPQARANLNVYSKGETDNLIPTLTSELTNDSNFGSSGSEQLTVSGGGNVNGGGNETNCSYLIMMQVVGNESTFITAIITIIEETNSEITTISSFVNIITDQSSGDFTLNSSNSGFSIINNNANPRTYKLNWTRTV